MPLLDCPCKAEDLPVIVVDQSDFGPTPDDVIDKVRDAVLADLSQKQSAQVKTYSCKRSKKFVCFPAFEWTPTAIRVTGPDEKKDLKPEDRYFYAFGATYEGKVRCKGFTPDEIHKAG